MSWNVKTTRRRRVDKGALKPRHLHKDLHREDHRQQQQQQQQQQQNKNKNNKKKKKKKKIYLFETAYVTSFQDILTQNSKL